MTETDPADKFITAKMPECDRIRCESPNPSLQLPPLVTTKRTRITSTSFPALNNPLVMRAVKAFSRTGAHGTAISPNNGAEDIFSHISDDKQKKQYLVLIKKLMKPKKTVKRLGKSSQSKHGSSRLMRDST